LLQNPQLPADPVSRFRQIYDALNAERGWFGEASPLRFAAVTAITCPGDAREVAAAIRKTAEDIKHESGWFGALNSNLRFIVGAMLVLHGDRASDFLDEVKRVQHMFRKLGLRRSAIYETMAILVLRTKAANGRVSGAAVREFQQMYEEMKRHHWWLTGPEDFPACAILVGGKVSVKQVGQDIEAIYQALNGKGFARGDPLQTAANILYLARVGADEVASRYAALATGFREKRVSIQQSDYDELAILSFLDHSAKSIVDSVLHDRKVMASLQPKPNRSLTFSLAASTTFLKLARLNKNLEAITGAKALLDMQAIINAQQAAAAAAAGSVAATSSSAGSSSC